MRDDIALHHLAPDTARLLIGAEVFDHAVDPGQLAAFVDDPGHEQVFAMRGRDVVGFASGVVLLHPDKPPIFFVNEVGVCPELRRQGIATALMHTLMGIARGRGCRGIWLATEGDNEEARAFYRNLGARETDDVVIYDWDGALDL